jgi:hypothetical protein
MPRRNSRKTANILQEVGRALYGDIWQSELARDLGCNDRTVRKWNAGDAPIPEYLGGEVAKICRRRGDRLIEIAEQLGATAKPSPGGAPPRQISPHPTAKSPPVKPPSDAQRPGASVPRHPPAPQPPDHPRNAPADVRGKIAPSTAPSTPGSRPGVIVPGGIAPTIRIVTVPKGAPLPASSSKIKYVRAE